MPAMASERIGEQTLDSIERRCNNLHALVADTSGARQPTITLSGHRGCRARSLEQQRCSTACSPARQALRPGCLGSAAPLHEFVDTKRLFGKR